MKRIFLKEGTPMHFQHDTMKDYTNHIMGHMSGCNRKLFQVLLGLAAAIGGGLSGGSPAKAFTPAHTSVHYSAGTIPLPPHRPSAPSRTTPKISKIPLPPVPPSHPPQSAKICDFSHTGGMFLAYEQMILDKGDTVIGVLRQHGISVNDANAFALALAAGAMDCPPGSSR